MEQIELPTTSPLRKRAHPMASGSLTSLMGENSFPESSQLPSPLSSVDENMRAVTEDVGNTDTIPSRNFTRRRRSTTKKTWKARSMPSTKDDSASDRMDIPLAVALVPPLGSFLTGGDFLRDLLLFLLLFFYLHQLIKLPWELYLASRPRGKRVRISDTPSDQERLHELVESELKTAELSYLTLSVLAPLIGAALLRYVGTALTGKDYISWFSTGVFVLVTGVRPWRHLGHRLRSRTEELQEAIQAYRTEGDDVLSRVLRLEEEIIQLKKEVATKDEIIKFHREVDESLDDLDVMVGKQRRVVELEKHTTDERLVALERKLSEALGSTSAALHPWRIKSPNSFFDWLHSQTFRGSKPIPSPIPHPARSSYRPRLAAVREEEDASGVTPRPRVRRPKSAFEHWLDLLVLPFSAGRTLLWGILHFLHRTLV